MSEDSTTALVAAVRRGEPRAFEALVRRHLRAAYSVALAVVRNTADAEDLAQEAFVLAFQRLDTCRDPARFAGWLLQIVRNRALNRLEQGKVRERAAGPMLSVVDGDAERLGLRRELLEALGQLTGVQREVVLLHDLEAWTHAEISEALELSEVSSRQHLFNARRVLRGILKDEAPAEARHGP